MGGQVDQLRQSWEEERRELAVQNQLLEEELADMKGMLMQERQRSAEAHSLKETVRRLRFENKEVCLRDHQEEMGGQVDQLRQSWEEERRELAVQNQLLEEELADMKGMLMQERQRSAEAHSLKETVRRLRFENKEVCLRDH